MAVFVPEEGRLGGMALSIKGIWILKERRIARVGAGAAMGRDVGDWFDLENSAHWSGFKNSDARTLGEAPENATAGDFNAGENALWFKSVGGKDDQAHDRT